MKTKTSYGIALYKYNKQNCIEIVLIRKRYSYHFFNFVFGDYNSSNEKYMIYLFDNMTASEKLDILSLQFELMWYRIWLNNPENHFSIHNIFEFEIGKNRMKYSDICRLFFAKKNKFVKNFMIDNGKKLKKYINNSHNVELIWEIPKGNIQKNKKETIIDCAIREFYEETNISPECYDLQFNLKPVIYSHKDDDILYKNVYFIAKLNETKSHIYPKISFTNLDQLYEVENIKWVSFEEIKFLNQSRKNYKGLMYLYKKIFNKIKKGNKIINILK